jgi:type II secretory pathway component PulK
MRTPVQRPIIPPARRGTILIVTMLVVFALAGITLTLCRSMQVEAIASANYAASLQASLIERGAEQYLLSMLVDQSGDLSQMLETDFACIQVGDGYFWVLRPDYGDASMPVFGLADEAAKLNINTATFDQLMCLPYMTDDVAAAIVDWRSDPTKSTPGGAESEYYLSLEDAYYCKNDLYETVEELLLVRGVTQQFLYGNGQAPPLGDVSSTTSAGSSSVTNDLWLQRGLYDLLTVYSIEPASAAGGAAGGTTPGARGAGGTPGAGGSTGRTTPGASAGRTTGTTATAATQLRGRINVNTAPREVLATLPGLEPADVDKLVSQRSSASATTSNSTAWVSQVLGQKAAALQNLITGKSYQYSADILAVSGNGRAFKRVRIVIDLTGTTPQIIYRRDNTDRGWPMDLQILESLRAGQGPGAWAGNGTPTPGGALR